MGNKEIEMITMKRKKTEMIAMLLFLIFCIGMFFICIAYMVLLGFLGEVYRAIISCLQAVCFALNSFAFNLYYTEARKEYLDELHKRRDQ